MSIKVIDSICGSGKTSYAIQYMNENINKHFIYVTPFLKEIERIKEQTIAEFVEPDVRMGRGRKIEHVRELVQENYNIVMTHELFARLDDNILSMIKCSNYTLIMDEVANVLNKEKISKDDIRLLINNNVITIDDEGRIIWKDKLYDGQFNDLKVLSERKNLYLHNDCILFWTMPVSNFSSFKDVFILTYLFDGQIQRYYYDLHNLDYEKYSIQKNSKGRYELISYNKKLEPRKQIGELLKVYEDYKKGKSVSRLNTNYLDKKDNPDKALSKNWFEHATKEQIDQLRKNLNTFFRSQNPVPNDQLIWTTFKNHAPQLKNAKCKLNKKDDRAKDNFLPFNARAINDYGNRTAIAFVLNRFMDPNEKQFFGYREIEVDEDLLAVSDLIQFLFRGCIRNNEPMACYIPSRRMRNLLKAWINFEI